MSLHSNKDPRQLERFRSIAGNWWDPEGEMRPLHDLNPIRLQYIADRGSGLKAAKGGGTKPLQGLHVLDIGCGGGLAAEGLARLGAEVLGIDPTEELLQVARDHAADGVKAGEFALEYRCCAAEDLLAEKQRWDLVTCLEVLEHVPDPAALVQSSAELLRPGGQVIFSTLNRTPQSFVAAIVGAEYLLQLLPRGTHSYEMLIRPSELAAWGRTAGLQLEDLTGLAYNPLSRKGRLTDFTGINYLAAFSRPAP